MEEQYLNIDNNFSNTFTSLVNKYLPKIKEIKKETDHWKIDDNEIKPRKKTRSERGDLLKSILSKINSEQRVLNKKEYGIKYLAYRLSHVPTKDLYYIDKEYKNNKIFFWSIKAKLDK